MNKLTTLLVVVASLVAFDAFAAGCCKARRACHERCAPVCDSVPAFVEGAQAKIPECWVPCVRYERVPAVREVSYYCPDTCLTTSAFQGHVEKIKSWHEKEGIRVQVQA